MMARENELRQLPSYQELPWNEILGGRISWDFFGADDELGTIGLIGNEQVAAAASEIVRGARFNLSLPLDQPNPAPGGRPHYEHHIYASERNSFDDWLDRLYMQSSTQWDGLRHVRAREFGFFNGISEEEATRPRGRLGIDRWAEHGIVTRAVLADVKRFADAHGMSLPAFASGPITTQLLASTLAYQNVSVRPGDVLLVRTGYLEALYAVPEEDRGQLNYPAGCPGLVGSEAMAELLWDWHVAAVCADNPAVEVRPGDRKDGSLHRRAIAMLGLALGELFNLDALAADSAEDHRYTSFFVGVPLNLPGGVGSPANAIACK
jgi:kynurenine formamidase